MKPVLTLKGCSGGGLPGWLAAGLLLLPLAVSAQKNPEEQPVPAGATFLMIAPDARSGGLGDALTGIEPNVNDLYGNAAKTAFAGPWGLSASYSPWMWGLNDKSQLGYLSAFAALNDHEALGLAIQYFNHGELTFRDETGNALQQYKPREYALAGSYARRLSPRLSLAVSLRYIHSDIGQGTYNGLQQKPASAVAGDLGLYYQSHADNLDFGNRYCWGISLSNLGNKLNYVDDDRYKTFLPMNLRLGGGYAFVHVPDHQLTVMADINKLLVPTMPVYEKGPNGEPTGQISQGRDPDRSVVSAVFTSLFDAPGGFGEEIREFTVASGMEYAYLHTLFLRIGYFYEHPRKGNRQHFAAGAGLRLNGFGADMAYLLPTGTSLRQTQTFKISLSYSPAERRSATGDTH